MRPNTESLVLNAPGNMISWPTAAVELAPTGTGAVPALIRTEAADARVLASGDSGAEAKGTERNGPFFLAHPRSWLNPSLFEDQPWGGLQTPAGDGLPLGSQFGGCSSHQLWQGDDYRRSRTPRRGSSSRTISDRTGPTPVSRRPGYERVLTVTLWTGVEPGQSPGGDLG